MIVGMIRFLSDCIPSTRLRGPLCFLPQEVVLLFVELRLLGAQAIHTILQALSFGRHVRNVNDLNGFKRLIEHFILFSALLHLQDRNLPQLLLNKLFSVFHPVFYRFEHGHVNGSLLQELQVTRVKEVFDLVHLGADQLQFALF